MKPFPVPIRVVGAGSHVEDEELQYIDMPRGMRVFQMPRVPQSAEAAHMAEARRVLARLLDRMEAWDPTATGEPPRLELDGLAAAPMKVVDEMLGEGEVAIRIDAERPFRIQESVFAGVWRVCELGADGAVVRDWVEASPIPLVVGEAARLGSAAELPRLDMPEGAMNSPALLVEIGQQMREWRARRPAHVVNLTLFPLSPADHEVMQKALPVGPVAIMSRGFGNCRITSTAARHVWRVQYFNNMNTLILDTLEVVDLPEVAIAAAEDLRESRERFGELLEWMAESADA
jgi:hydrogenase-1 operon protein HyaF